jgi:hypothetical protein
LALGVFVFIVETLILKALLAGVAVALVNATSFIQVNVFFVTGAGTTVVGLLIIKAVAGTILGEWEATTTAVGVAITATAATGALLARTESVVVAAGKLATLGGASTHVTKPFVVAGIPVAVEVNSLVGKTKVKVLGVNHTTSEGVVGGTAKVGHVNRVSEVKVLGTTVRESGDKVNVGVRLDYPDKLLNRVVKVEFNFVAGRVDGLGTSELKLFNQVLV